MEMWPSSISCKGLGETMLRIKNWHIVGAQLMLFIFPLPEEGGRYPHVFWFW